MKTVSDRTGPRSNWRVGFLDTTVAWVSVGGGLIALLLGVFIAVDETFTLKSWWPSYAGYGSLIALNGLKSRSFRFRSMWLVGSLHLVAASSLFVLGLDAGPVLVAFTAIVVAGVLLSRAWAFASLALMGGIVGATQAFLTPLVVPPSLSVAGFVGASLPAMMFVLWVVRSLENELSHRIQDLETLQEEREERESVQAVLSVTRERLQEAERFEAVGRVAGGVAHEFNNLLQLILAWTEVLESAHSEEEKVEAFERIQAATIDAGEVTGALLSVARRGSNQSTVVDLAASIEHWSSGWKHILRDDVDVVFSLAPVGHVRVNAGALEQALLNLLRNAADISVGSSTIRVEVRRVESPERPVEILVIDDGCGMSPEDLGRVFEPFFSSKGVRGTGLGLSIVRGTIEQFKGEIHLSSQLGQGTTAQIRLPLVAFSPVEVEKDDSKLPLPRGRRILVAEDEADVRRATVRHLRAEGYQVFDAKDGDEALQCLQEVSALDLLVIDGRMPGASTEAVIQAFRESSPSGRVVVCSGNVESRALRELIDKDSLKLLVKPYRKDDLLQAIRE